MSDYEIFILGGSFLLIIGLIKFFASVTTRKPIGVGVLIFAVGGGLLVYANTLQPGGMMPADVPNALFKLIGRTF
ncbi:hypothetical protein LGT41_0000870 [Abyssibius alkaniclasticus]|uniref:hypothetical protein n=1 Tax=Abyssibius alkaniclasticus TaxID=2881234 RepID=UPI0023647E08|nr:hypothetical protein [Abyssibius alkaniclasticus]UPH71398.1 hypothetical protein LGT41_0000870 [Abyssibius alkaniclasticus]|tara:strand:- start:1110 stop:1334 length:225 start_codon:yes stop_codon:yes gene_type:complete